MIVVILILLILLPPLSNGFSQKTRVVITTHAELVRGQRYLDSEDIMAETNGTFTLGDVTKLTLREKFRRPLRPQPARCESLERDRSAHTVGTKSVRAGPSSPACSAACSNSASSRSIRVGPIRKGVQGISNAESSNIHPTTSRDEQEFYNKLPLARHWHGHGIGAHGALTTKKREQPASTF